MPSQLQAAFIKRTLSLMLPGVKIFLDVDDLDSIKKLESYISQSQCILFFISKGCACSLFTPRPLP
mgnify:CR=1 FL=1